MSIERAIHQTRQVGIGGRGVRDAIWFGRTTNVDAVQHGSHGPIRAQHDSCGTRVCGECVVAQWSTVDIAAVGNTQTQIQLAVGEPLRIVLQHLPLDSK